METERFCPRCDTVTVWDSPGTPDRECTNWPEGEPAHCGFTLASTLTVEEAARMDTYERRLNRWEQPPARNVDRPAPSGRTVYQWV